MRTATLATLALASACGSSSPEVAPPPASASADLLKSWQAYLKAVRLHEAGHRTIAERNAREVMAALTPLRGANCDLLSDEASRTAERLVADGRARNRAYDVETKHGQTQGVVLQP